MTEAYSSEYTSQLPQQWHGPAAWGIVLPTAHSQYGLRIDPASAGSVKGNYRAVTNQALLESEFFFSVPVFFRENELIYVQFLHNFYKIIAFQTEQTLGGCICTWLVKLVYR
jgi:hypothetical protein